MTIHYGEKSLPTDSIITQLSTQSIRNLFVKCFIVKFLHFNIEDNNRPSILKIIGYRKLNSKNTTILNSPVRAIIASPRSKKEMLVCRKVVLQTRAARERSLVCEAIHHVRYYSLTAINCLPLPPASSPIRRHQRIYP